MRRGVAISEKDILFIHKGKSSYILLRKKEYFHLVRADAALDEPKYVKLLELYPCDNSSYCIGSCGASYCCDRCGCGSVYYIFDKKIIESDIIPGFRHRAESRGFSLSKNYAAILRNRAAGVCVGGKEPPARLNICIFEPFTVQKCCFQSVKKVALPLF